MVTGTGVSYTRPSTNIHRRGGLGAVQSDLVRGREALRPAISVPIAALAAFVSTGPCAQTATGNRSLFTEILNGSNAF